MGSPRIIDVWFKLGVEMWMAEMVKDLAVKEDRSISSFFRRNVEMAYPEESERYRKGIVVDREGNVTYYGEFAERYVLGDVDENGQRRCSCGR